MTALQLVSECLGEGPLAGKLVLEAVHFAYGLRGQESADEAAFVRSHCQQRGIPLQVIAAGEPPATGIQEWARELRLAHYQKRRAQGAIIVTGHHKDDLAETVLLRVARGTHPAGLLGMTWWQHGIWRPLLNIARPAIEELARRKKLPFRHDSSNDKLDYSRNRVRHAVLPELQTIHEDAAQHVIGLAESCDQLAQFVRQTARVTLEQADYRPTVGWLDSLPKAVATMVLGLMIQKARGVAMGKGHTAGQQPGSTTGAFLAAVSAWRKADSQGQPKALPPIPKVQAAGGGYFTIVRWTNAGQTDWRAQYCDGSDTAPFRDVHARHQRNLALRPVAAIIPAAGRLFR